jgi:hypothetical protein
VTVLKFVLFLHHSTLEHSNTLKISVSDPDPGGVKSAEIEGENEAKPKYR